MVCSNKGTGAFPSFSFKCFGLVSEKSFISTILVTHCLLTMLTTENPHLDRVSGAMWSRATDWRVLGEA